jgi:hypothetical protein
MAAIMNSITIPKVNVGTANQLWSDRRHNPDEMTCQIWGGKDLTGRAVCSETFLTTDAGCDSALYRILTENDLRANYAEYQTLDTRGYTDDLYGSQPGTVQGEESRRAARRRNMDANNTPRFGLVSNQKVRPGGAVRESDIAVRSSVNQDKNAALAEDSRRKQAVIIGNKNNIMLANPRGDFMQPITAPGKDIDSDRYMKISQYNKNIKRV